MTNTKTIVILGLGEVGKPLLELASRSGQNVVGIDIAPPAQPIGEVDFLHICYPFEIKDFIGVTARYIERYKPAVTIINSTVSVGTTRSVADRAGAPVVHSPVRGKHIRMLEEMQHYVKFIGASDPAIGDKVAKHFESIGMKTRVLSSPEATELAKLTETTYFGVMIAWAQEVERYCDQTGQDYSEISAFWEEIKFFPQVKYFPGVIGGHCVMPNIEILSRLDNSAILKAVQLSNRQKVEREKKLKAVDAVPVAAGKCESLA